MLCNKVKLHFCILMIGFDYDYGRAALSKKSRATDQTAGRLR